MKQYLFNILISIDKFFNVLLSPFLNFAMGVRYQFGDHRDTLSEVFGRNRGNCKFCHFICKILHWADDGHCEKSIEDDEK